MAKDALVREYKIQIYETNSVQQLKLLNQEIQNVQELPLCRRKELIDLGIKKIESMLAEHFHEHNPQLFY